MIGSYKLTVDGKDISDQIFGSGANKIIYRDNMGLVSDTMDITLNDAGIDKQKLFPDGAQVEAEFTTDAGKTLKTGALFVDTYDGRIDSGGDAGGSDLTVGTNSQPEKRPSMRTYISYNKKEVLLSVLLRDVLRKADLGLVYRFDKAPFQHWYVKLKSVTHQNEQLGPILRQYAEMFGCYLKVYDDKVIYANKEAFKLDPVLKTINPSETSVRGFRYNINEHQYNEYEVSYYDPRTGKYTQDKKSKKSVLTTDSETVKRIIASIADVDAARALAMAVDGQRQAYVTFNTDGDDKAIAGAVWEITQLMKLSGKYVITSAVHTIDKNWTVEINADNIF